MLKTPAERLQYIKDHSGLSQTEFGKIIGLNQGTLSKRINSNTAIKPQEAEKIEASTGYRAEWLLFGRGEKILQQDTSILQEPDEEYIPTHRYSDKSIVKRFVQQAIEYKACRSITQAEMCDLLHINKEHFSAIKNEHKPMTLHMLINAAQYGNFNLNYTVSAIGEYFIDPSGKNNHIPEIAKLQQELINKQKLIDTQSMLIEQLTKK